MGVVYEAFDRRLERRVALKELHAHLVAPEETHNGLIREARTAARVEHENVVRIYNIHDLDGGLYLEMEFVDGVPLSHLLEGRRLSPTHAADVLSQTLNALAACHAKGVVHGDLKPSNLLITPDGAVKLTDFGIALVGMDTQSLSRNTATMTHGLWGTPQYCPPEAWEGGRPTAAWDLYALGVLIFEALTGSLPYAAETPAMLMREKLEGTRASITSVRSDLSRELSELVDALGSDDVRARVESAQAALDKLSRTPEIRETPSETQPLSYDRSDIRREKYGPSQHRVRWANSTPSALRRSLAGKFTPYAILFFLLIPVALIGLNDSSRHPESLDISNVSHPIIEPAGKIGEIRELVVAKNRAFYSYDDGIQGRELWITDENGQSRIVADLNPGYGSSNPSGFLRREGGAMIFTAATPEYGEELWFCEPYPPRARLLKDVARGSIHSSPKPVASWNHLFLFYATNLESQGALWITDGDELRTGLLRDAVPEATAVDSTTSSVFLGKSSVYFIGTSTANNDLIRFRFGQMEFESLGRVSPGIRDLAEIGDHVVFAMEDSAHGYELWFSDTDAKQTELLNDIWIGPKSGNPEDFCSWNNEIYFRATTAEYGTELWKTDGTTQGTVQVFDLHPGKRDGDPSNFTGTQNLLFFRATNDNCGWELWATTGEPGSPPKVYDVWPGPDSSSPYNLTAIGNFLFFSADHAAYGEELWAVDLRDLDRPAFLVEDIRPGPEGSEPHDLSPMTERKAIFITESDQGQRLMMLEIADEAIEITPCDALPLELGAGE